MEELLKELEAVAQMETCKDRDKNFDAQLTGGTFGAVQLYLKGKFDGRVEFSRELVEKLKGITNDNKGI